MALFFFETMARAAASGRARGSARAPRPTKKRAAPKAAPPPKRTRPNPDGDDDDDDEALAELATDAQAMVGSDDDDDVGAMHFLSRAHLPDVSEAGAQGRERERVQAEKRKQRETLDAMRRPPEHDAPSEDSTDMEGASDSEEASELDGDGDLDDEDLEDEDLDDDDAGASDLEDDDAGASDLEDAYLQQAAKRSKREERAQERAREALAHRRLPVRTEDGAIEELDADEAPEPEASRVVFRDSDLESSEEEAPAPRTPASSAVHSTRFGLRAPYEIIAEAHASDAARLAAGLALAREQIAHLASQIVGDPELGLHWLRRLLVFAHTHADAPPDAPGKPRVPVHAYIRQLALLSLLAVFVDILPGYRIRPLSEQEAQERVSQEVARRRDWEQGLVVVYREYLEVCEAEVRRATPLAPVALRSFCTLLTRASHFNYRKNLLAVIVSQLSRRAWTASSEQCYAALATLLADDHDGEVSLEAVMLLYRMIRERKLAVHANVLDILAHLRLRDELGTHHRTGPMGSASAAPARAPRRTSAAESRRADPRAVRKGLAAHVSKKQAKRNRELRAIESEMREAEAAVDVEERSRNVRA